MSIKNILIALALVLGIVNLALLLYPKQGPARLAYIDIDKAFNDFELKKELEKSFAANRQEKQQRIDSLIFELNLTEKKFNTLKNIPRDEIVAYDIKKQEYYARIKKLEEENSLLLQEYDTQIKNQLNTFAQQYGKDNGYAYIFSNVNGSLMYADKSSDITADFVLYMNKKYAGKR